MRWWAMIIGMLAGILLLAGCGEPPAEPPVTISLLTFHYDPLREVALAVTRDAVISPQGTFTASRPAVLEVSPPGDIPKQPYSNPTRPAPNPGPNDREDYGVVSPSYIPELAPPISAQEYADALAMLTHFNISPAPCVTFAGPCPTVHGGTLTVNYTCVSGLEQLTDDEALPILVSLQAWWWVPHICDVQIQADCQALTMLGSYNLGDCQQHNYHTFVLQEQTGEVAYLLGAICPKDLDDALDILEQREISTTPAANGFTPLIPPDVPFTAHTDSITDGVLTFDLPCNYPLCDQFRLAGLVLMLTQFPCVTAVQFTFGGSIVDACFMRSNLDRPLTPADLILPSTVSLAPCCEG